MGMACSNQCKHSDAIQVMIVVEVNFSQPCLISTV